MSQMPSRPLTSDGRARILANDLEMPLLGLGVWQSEAGRETEDAVRFALEAGYRHIDTAQAYGNEESVGAALRDGGVPREEIFVTTKFFPGSEDPEREAEESLRRLGIDQVDLYLVHWPQGGPTRAWAGMQRALERGLTRAIGVSNFDVEELEALLAVADSPPVVNQIQLSPFTFRRALIDACEGSGVAVEAYSPLTTGRDLGDPAVAEVAQRVGRTPAQVLIRWGLERDVIEIPKSVRRERIAENGQVFDFSLSPEDLEALDALDRTDGTGTAVESPWW